MEFHAGNASTNARHDKALFFLADKGAALNNMVSLVCRALIPILMTLICHRERSRAALSIMQFSIFRI